MNYILNQRSHAHSKYSQWKYEVEVRVIVEKPECVKNDGKYFYNLNPEVQLRGLILGPLCEITTKMIEQKLPPQKTLSVMKSRLAFRSFNIVTQEEFKKSLLSGES